jgi:hypothetical protein
VGSLLMVSLASCGLPHASRFIVPAERDTIGEN